jgi:hypothetical protein
MVPASITGLALSYRDYQKATKNVLLCEQNILCKLTIIELIIRA